MKKLLAIALPALALSIATPLHAGEPASSPPSEEELRHAHEELDRAREELRRAAEELARLTREAHRDSPRAEAYEYMTNPKRAMLGITIADGPEKNGQIRGVLVTGVTPGSGAEKAGLKSGDLLVSAKGQKLATKASERGGPEHRLRDIMGELKPGDQVALDYEREGRRDSTIVTAQRAEDIDWGSMFSWNDDDEHDMVVPPVPPVPPTPPVPPMPFSMHMRDRGSVMGMELAKLDPDLAGYFHTDKGVLVVSAPHSGTLGLKSGDVITQVDGKAVDNPVEVWDRIAEARDDEKVRIDVVRQGRSMNLEGTLPEHRRVYRREIEIEGPHGDRDRDDR